MIVSIDKTYRTRSGAKVILYAVYPDQKYYPVHGALVYEGETQAQTWTLAGKYTHGTTASDSLDLVEASPSDDWKVDDKILVWDSEDSKQYRRYFAGISSEGYILAYANGATSWSAYEKEVLPYRYGKLATISTYSKEEL